MKLCNFDIQIIIQTDNIDLEKHITEIEKIKKVAPELSSMVDDYNMLIKNISQIRESIVRKFYMVINECNAEKIKTELIECGNIVLECSKEECFEIFYRYFKKNKKMRKELKWV